MKNFVLAGLTLILLVGCAQQPEINNKSEAGAARSTKKTIDMGVSHSISDALVEIGKIDGNQYYIKNGDMLIPIIKNKQISSFDELDAFMRDTTNYGLFITKNKYRIDRIKVVELKDVKAIGAELENMEFSLRDGDVNIAKALDKLSDKIKYSIIFISNSGAKENPLKAKELEGQYVNYRGASVGDFLSYLTKSQNLIIDIDYSDRIIEVRKTKTIFFDVDKQDTQAIKSFLEALLGDEGAKVVASPSGDIAVTGDYNILSKAGKAIAAFQAKRRN